MLEIIVTIFTFGTIGFLVWKVFRFIKGSDITFGNKAIASIINYLNTKNYTKAENAIQQLNPDDFTATLDAIGLKVATDSLKKWEENTTNPELVQLGLGVHYLHKAWIARSHEYASNVSQKKAENFYDLLAIAEDYFSLISKESPYAMEKYSRMIRLTMSQDGYTSEATTYFDLAAENNKDFFYPYIHLAEVLQPKWGGNQQLITDFINTLPDHFLIKNTVKLKLLLDSYICSENYFEGDLEYTTHKILYEIDSKIDKEQINSIHKYMLYNYMKELASMLNKKKLVNKYKKASKNYPTLYPYGVIL